MTTTPMAADTATANRVRPMTGSEYLESLRDGREIYFRGERVDDVTTHPAFRNSARSGGSHVRRLAPTGRRGLALGAHRYRQRRVHPPVLQDRPQRRRPAHRPRRDHHVAARKVYGWLGRSPDYKASFLGTLGANSDFYGEYKQNALDWYKKSQERVLYLNHAIVNPPIDRDKPADETADVCVHVVKETDAGLIVLGRQGGGHRIVHQRELHRTLRSSVAQEEFGLIFTVPMDSPAA